MQLTVNRISTILEKYQEDCSILDPILEGFVTPIMKFMQAYVRKTVLAQSYYVPDEVRALFITLAYMCKVRGYKTVVKFFPHEVSDMEHITELLHFQEVDHWEVPYILVLWLSIVILVPFDLTSIDSGKQSQEILVKRIANIGRNFSGNPGKIRDGAAVMLGNLMSRPDVVKSGETDLFLTQLNIDYESVCNDSKKIFNATGILQILVEVFKTGHRDDLLPRINTIFDPIIKKQTIDKFMSKSKTIKKAKVNIA